MARRIGGGIGKRVGSAVPGRGGVGVGAVGIHDHRAVDGVGVAGDGQSCTAVVRQNRGTVQHLVDHRRGVVVYRQGVHGDKHRGR